MANIQKWVSFWRDDRSVLPLLKHLCCLSAHTGTCVNIFEGQQDEGVSSVILNPRQGGVSSSAQRLTDAVQHPSFKATDVLTGHWSRWIRVGMLWKKKLKREEIWTNNKMVFLVNSQNIFGQN